MKLLIVVSARNGAADSSVSPLKTVAGISLVGRAVRLGQRALFNLQVDGRVFVDTDSKAVASEAREWGASATGLGKPRTATGPARAAEDALEACAGFASRGEQFEVVISVEACAPLLTAADLGACYRACEASGSSVLTVGGGAEAEPVPAVAAARYQLLRERRAFVVPGITSLVKAPAERSIWARSESDLELAELLLRRLAVPGFRIAGREIGGSAPCFVIAEAGVNHNGDPAIAHRLLDAAADAGADAVKFQTFDPKRLASAKAPMAGYQVENSGREESQAAMLERLVLSREAHAELKVHAEARGLMMLSTPFDEASADFLEELGLPALKVPSGELTNLPFLAHLARKRMPLLVSTGMANMRDVAAALDVIAMNGGPFVGLFHCVTSYPAAPEDTNLRAMDTLRAAFQVPTGHSDHSTGDVISFAAVARGASLLEKHFTLDRGMPGPDHQASIEPRELAQLVAGVRVVETALGDGRKVARPCEIPLMAAARKSLHGARDVPAGATLGAGDLEALRPGDGISPAQLGRVIGRVLRRPLLHGEKLVEDHLEDG